MWHKPCRTFHPWCLCIKTRCLLIMIDSSYSVLHFLVNPSVTVSLTLAHYHQGDFVINMINAWKFTGLSHPLLNSCEKHQVTIKTDIKLNSPQLIIAQKYSGGQIIKSRGSIHSKCWTSGFSVTSDFNWLLSRAHFTKCLWAYDLVKIDVAVTWKNTDDPIRS